MENDKSLGSREVAERRVVGMKRMGRKRCTSFRWLRFITVMMQFSENKGRVQAYFGTNFSKTWKLGLFILTVQHSDEELRKTRGCLTFKNLSHLFFYKKKNILSRNIMNTCNSWSSKSPSNINIIHIYLPGWDTFRGSRCMPSTPFNNLNI